jgi:phage FluMu protein Com
MNEESKCRYYIFKCRYPGCNEHIPAEFFCPRSNAAQPPLWENHAKWHNDLAVIDVHCPFCRLLNQFQVREHVKEISRQEFEAETREVRARISVMNVINKVLTQNCSVTESLSQLQPLGG